MAAINASENHSYFSCDSFPKASSKQYVQEPVESDNDSFSSSSSSNDSKPESINSDNSLFSADPTESISKYLKRESIDSDKILVFSSSESNTSTEPICTTKRQSVDSEDTLISVATSDKSPQPIIKEKSYSSVVNTGIQKDVSHVAPTSNTLDIDKIVTGKDSRTTFMIRNIPNKYTQVININNNNICCMPTYIMM